MKESLNGNEVRRIMEETYGREAATWVKVDLALELGLLEAQQRAMSFEEALHVGWNKAWLGKKKITPIVHEYIYNERLPFKILIREGMGRVKSNSFLIRAMTVVAIQIAVLAGKDGLAAVNYARKELDAFENLTGKEWNGINAVADRTVRRYSTFDSFDKEVKSLMEEYREEIEKLWEIFQIEAQKRFGLRKDLENKGTHSAIAVSEVIKETVATEENIAVSEPRALEPEKSPFAGLKKDEKEELLEDYVKRICELEKTVSFLLNDNKRLRDAQENSFIQGMSYLLGNMNSDSFGNPLGELMLEARRNETQDKKNRMGFLAQSLLESLLYCKLSLLDEELDCEVSAEEVFKSGKYRLDELKNYEGEQGIFKVVYPGWEYRNMVLVKPLVEKWAEEDKK